jgi:hypothetical protein
VGIMRISLSKIMNLTYLINPKITIFIKTLRKSTKSLKKQSHGFGRNSLMYIHCSRSVAADAVTCVFPDTFFFLLL